MKENRELELKLIITNTFLKTVSAFANYGSGRIIFGIDDNGKVVGIDDLDETCLNLENKINDNIVPKPNFSFIKNNRDKTITLVVKEGLDKPYLYKGKAYKRNDTSTIEVDRLELNRLTLEGMNRYFEELRSNDQDLKFEILKKELKEKLGIENFSIDLLKTLNLYNDKEGYNNAAALVADRNSFSGIDIARFGKDINEILDRNIFVNMSIFLNFIKL